MLCLTTSSHIQWLSLTIRVNTTERGRNFILILKVKPSQVYHIIQKNSKNAAAISFHFNKNDSQKTIFKKSLLKLLLAENAKWSNVEQSSKEWSQWISPMYLKLQP